MHSYFLGLELLGTLLLIQIMADKVVGIHQEYNNNNVLEVSQNNVQMGMP